MNIMPATGVYVNADGSPLLPLLNNATGSIDIEIYTMGDLTVRTLLRSALARGVRIRVVKEPKPLGDDCDLFGVGNAPLGGGPDCADQRLLVSQIRAAGGTFEPFNKGTLCPNGGGTNGNGCFEHGKIVIADGLALVSTGNFDATNLCIASENPSRCDRDYTLVVNDPVLVGTLESLFEADLRGTAYDVRSLIPASLSQTLTVSPFSLNPLVDFIHSANTSIDLEAQYLEDPQLNAALLDAAQNRGVKINVTVSSVCAFGSPSAQTSQLVTQTYSAFDQAGISTRMFNATDLIDGKPGYMHAKVIVVDGSRAWLGSENGSNESLAENREYGVIFGDAASVATILATVQADHASPQTESWQESLHCAKDPQPPQP